MAQSRDMMLALNRGVISPLGLGRIDLKRMAYAAEEQTNIMPRVLGSAALRPGFEYIAQVKQDATPTDLPAITVPFVFSATEQALIEFSGAILAAIGYVRVLVDDVLVTRPTVTAAVTNSAFISDLTGWADSDESGATSSWSAGTAFYGYMNLLGDGLNAAIREQQVTVNETGVEHALNITVARGPVTLRVGSTAGAEDYIAELQLGTGEHSLAFTPTGNFHIHLSNRLPYTVNLQLCTVATAGVMQFSSLYSDADLPFIRHEQSGDIIFVACKGLQQRKVERHSDRSWSFTYYESEAGPFRVINTTDITMAPSALSGDTIITASKAFFRPTHVGGMIRIASHGQDVQQAITAEDQFSDPIKVIGIDDSRIFNIVISGTFSATVTVQYSVAEPGAWVDLATTYTIPTTTTHDDGLDNQIIYYRIGVKAGDYTSGTADVQLTIASGSISGIARIHTYSNATVVNVTVLRSFGGTAASTNWWESDWSGYRGWPSAVGLHEGRMAWAGLDKIWQSVSDQYYSFDDDVVGDSGPISRNIGFGPIQDIFWLLSLERLLMGTATNASNIQPQVIDGDSVIAIRSTAFDEPVTPTNFNLKTVAPLGVYVDRSGQRLFLLQFDGTSNDYVPEDTNKLTPDLNQAGIQYIAVQSKPDIRVHCVLADGTVSVLVVDRVENVAAWIPVTTDGLVEHVSVLPGDIEDQVYYVIKRNINGVDVRYTEKWALESDCQGGTLNKQADSFFEYSGASTATITGLDHLEGETVYAWGNGKNLGSYTVSSGSITLSEAVTACIVGLTYRGRFRGAKLASLFPGGLNHKRRISQFGLSMLNTHHQGIRYGSSFTEMYDLPAVFDDKEIAADTVFADFDFDLMSFGGTWSTDSRLHLEMNAPKPATIQAVTMVVDD